MDSIDLIRLAKEGNTDAREEVIVNNLALVWSIVRRFSQRGYEAEDLFQIGSIGLMKAIDRFDVTYDVKFSTYAVPMIIGEIKRFLRDDGMIKVSRSLKENLWKINSSIQKFLQENNKEPTVKELSEYTGISINDIILAQEAGYEIESIECAPIPVRKDENDKLIDHMLLEELISILPEDEKKLIKLRYFYDKTQTEVAKVLGISQVQVSRLEKKVLNKMRKKAVG